MAKAPLPTQDPERQDFEQAAREKHGSFLGEMWGFLAHNKKWWMLPIIVVLVIVAGLVVFGSSPLAPLIYTLF